MEEEEEEKKFKTEMLGTRFLGMQASEWLSGRSSVRLCAGWRVLRDGQCVVRNVQSGPRACEKNIESC